MSETRWLVHSGNLFLIILEAWEYKIKVLAGSACRVGQVPFCKAAS